MSTQPQSNTPNLATTLSGPLLDLESDLLKHQNTIENWFRREWLKTPAPFYASVDLRNAGFKLAPVDTNLFPAGFNNLNSSSMPLCKLAIQTAIERTCPEATGVVLIPENHTRNTAYLENLHTLSTVIADSGFEVQIGSLREGLTESETLTLPSGHTIDLHPITRTGNMIEVNGFRPCLIVMNNDSSGGRPAILEDLKQSIAPPLDLGWSDRLKSEHFSEYRRVAKEFSDIVGIDSWLTDPLFRNCGEINYKKREGEDCLARNVKELLAEIQKKYDQYGIDRDPFVIIKADSGTYGMGVMTVHSADEVRQLNRKQRTKMSYAKEGQDVSTVIMQEGVYTFETWGPMEAAAEPVVYMIDRVVVGGFFRVHTERGANENLNAPGMQFEPLPFTEGCCEPDKTLDPNAEPNRLYAYGVVARLALLAAAREIALAKNGETAGNE